MRIIRNCNKIIVSDATINNNTFNLLKNRPNDKNYLLITNIKNIRVLMYLNLIMKMTF